MKADEPRHAETRSRGKLRLVSLRGADARESSGGARGGARAPPRQSWSTCVSALLLLLLLLLQPQLE